MDVHENLATSKLDDDVKISMVLREAPQKLRGHLRVNSQQFDRDYINLKAIIQAYLNTNKTRIASDFRVSDPIDVDHTGKGESKSKSKGKGKTKAKAKAKATKSPTTTKNATCAEKKRVISHETVGDESTTIKWWTRSKLETPMPSLERNLCSRSKTWSAT